MCNELYGNDNHIEGMNRSRYGITKSTTIINTEIYGNNSWSSSQSKQLNNNLTL